jgi:cell division septation protein DedD
VKTGSGKKFSITIQVPDDIAAQWPDRTTAEKLVQEVYTAMGSAPASGGSPPKAVPPRPTAPAPPQERRGIAVVLLAALVAGGIGGYLGARTYLGPMASVDRSAAPAPARVEPARPLPTSPAQQPQTDLSTTPATSAAQTPTSPPGEQPAASKPLVNAPAYGIQVGAYRMRENAQLLLLRLHQDGFPAEIVYSAGLYVIQLGPFQTRQDANQLVDKLKARRYDAVIVRFTSAGN